MSQFIHKPKNVHWKAALRILTYIKGFPEKRLLYKKIGHLLIEAFSDSSYAADRRDMKSTSSYYICVRGNLVTWRRLLCLNLVPKPSIELWLI